MSPGKSQLACKTGAIVEFFGKSWGSCVSRGYKTTQEPQNEGSPPVVLGGLTWMRARKTEGDGRWNSSCLVNTYAWSCNTNCKTKRPVKKKEGCKAGQDKCLPGHSL